MPAGHPAMRTVTQAAASAPAAILTGKVLETFNSAGYTYLRIQTKGGEEWAAVRETRIKKGAIVNVAPQMTAENFESSSLKRKFDRIVFGTIADGSAAAAPVSMVSSAQMPAGHPPSGMNAAPPMGGPSEHMQAPAASNVKVDKADGGKTVAEIWSGAAAGKDKPVVVRGKVVKFLTGIMGKNWIHLRDGSGSPDKGDDDITITTNDIAKIGDVVVVTGTLKVDKDFGAGYRYPVIIEDAKITK
ncbi:MAG: nucleotide-binding protein [Thermoanaerobaculia bacterium]|nr:nucleotide-binding protein [Thermoanaerobaculia bacterium]